MGFRIVHEYALGSLDEIKQGINVEKTFDLDKTLSLFQERNSSSSIIIMPVVIGVYRRGILGSDSLSNLDDLAKGGAAREILRVDFSDKSRFDVHPSLVQIGYDLKILSKNIISTSIGFEAERMIIKPYTQLGQYSSLIGELEVIMQKKFDNLDDPVSEQDLQSIIQLSNKMLYSEGLTRHEWVKMNTYMIGKNLPQTGFSEENISSN